MAGAGGTRSSLGIGTGNLVAKIFRNLVQVHSNSRQVVCRCRRCQDNDRPRFRRVLTKFRRFAPARQGAKYIYFPFDWLAFSRAGWMSGDSIYFTFLCFSFLLPFRFRTWRFCYSHAVHYRIFNRCSSSCSSISNMATCPCLIVPILCSGAPLGSRSSSRSKSSDGESISLGTLSSSPSATLPGATEATLEVGNG